MAKLYSQFIIIALCMLSLTGCEERTASPAVVSFPSERAMRDVLRGSWILQAYTDSVDAGLTPRLLEYLLERQHSISYYPDINTGASDPAHLIYTWRGQDAKEERLTAEFSYRDNKIVFYTPADKTTGTPARQVAMAEFLINMPDTILRFYVDSAADSSWTFIKYDVTICPNVSPYSHLLNSKFITGKYFREDDRGHQRHIIFTRCGNIEGAQNIEEKLSGYTEYGVSISHFAAEPDAVRLYSPSSKTTRYYYWSISADSLILTPGATPTDSRIVLVKAK